MSSTTLFDRLAELYETVRALDPTAGSLTGRATGKPGSRVPPGMTQVLDDDEYRRTMDAVDGWTARVVDVLTSYIPGVGSVPDETPGRLRVTAKWATQLRAIDNSTQWYDIWAGAESHMTALRILARRGSREVQTKSPCMLVTCEGEYVAQIDGPDVDGDLTCDRCGDKVASDQWSRWGGTRSKPDEWVTADKARALLGLETVQGVYMRAKRQKWRRRGGKGRENVRFHREDVMRDTSNEERSSA